MPIVLRVPVARQAIGIHATFRASGGGLTSQGLAYSALFALVPALILVVAGVSWLVDEPEAREQAIDLIARAFPALEPLSTTAVEAASRSATVGSVIALIGFGWAASGFYLNLTRAMEHFFPGERVSGVFARLAGILLVLLLIVGVVAAVLLANVIAVAARALAVDAEWVMTAIGASVTLGLAATIVYGVYRVVPSTPPSASSARLPALLVGLAIGIMTLAYGLVSPWLVEGFALFGVMATVFVALVWLRVVFLAMIYGAAMARYRDRVALARRREAGQAEADGLVTSEILEEEAARAVEGAAAAALRKAEQALQAPVSDEAATDRPDGSG